MYDSIKPVLLVGALEGNFLASFALGWAVTTGAGICSYPLDTIRRRMMMTSGEVCIYRILFLNAFVLIKILIRRSSTVPRSLPVVKLLHRRASAPFSKVLVPTSFVVSLALVYYRFTIRSNCLCLARPSRADPAKRFLHGISLEKKDGIAR